MNYVQTLVKALARLTIRVSWNIWGSIQTPYSTYRTLISQDLWQLLLILALAAIYFFGVSPIKLHSLHPLLLTLNASRLFVTAIISFLLICSFLRLLGNLFGASSQLRAIALAWGYSLIPTLIWFSVTTLFYVILPPPRHATIAGIAFSLLYLTFSLSLFFWKGLLYYLTLRFALRLDLLRIIGISLIFLPTLALYSLLLYYFGIFKVPFV